MTTTEPTFNVKVWPADGNAYSVMGAAVKAMRRAGATPEQIKEYQTDAMFGDYDHVLQVTMRWVDLQAGYPPDEEDDDLTQEEDDDDD